MEPANNGAGCRWDIKVKQTAPAPLLRAHGRQLPEEVTAFSLSQRTSKLAPHTNSAHGLQSRRPRADISAFVLAVQPLFSQVIKLFCL